MSDGSKPLSGRVALVTGANTGIGLPTAVSLAMQGARVFIACRSPERGAAALEEIRRRAGAGADLLDLDLGNFDSVRACARAFLDRGLPLHLLINNAGVGGRGRLSKSGFEMQFGVNHMGHFLLTQLLLDRIRESAPARIVTVASRAHHRAPGIDFDAVRAPGRSRNGMREYRISKLANVLFSAELGRKLAGSGVTTYSLHPGVVATDIWRGAPWIVKRMMKLVLLSPEQGAQTTLHCATSADAATQTGLYYDRSRVREPSVPARDLGLARELWDRSEAWSL